jgi:hypothetical protein
MSYNRALYRHNCRHCCNIYMPYFSSLTLTRASDARSRNTNCSFWVSVRGKQKAESMMLSHYVCRGNCCDMAPLWALSPPPHTQTRALYANWGRYNTGDFGKIWQSTFCRSQEPTIAFSLPHTWLKVYQTCRSWRSASCSGGSELHSRWPETKLSLGLSRVFSVA